jgi:hypothetical protein
LFRAVCVYAYVGIPRHRHDLPAIWLDGRDIDPSPSGFLFALGQALGLDEEASPLEVLATHPRGVLLIDTYETLAPLQLAAGGLPAAAPRWIRGRDRRPQQTASGLAHRAWLG